MVINVVVPQLGESITEAVLIKWRKADGEAVRETDALCELETDKANVDLPAPTTGVLKRVINEGTTVRIGDLVATIDTAAKAVTAPAPKTASPAAATAKPIPPAAAARPAPPAAPTAVKLEDFSPAVRQLLAEHKLDPAAVIAKVGTSGRGNRLMVEDVHKYIGSGSRPAAPAALKTEAPTLRQAFVPASAPGPVVPEPEPPAPAAFSTNGNAEPRRVPMTKIRKKIAERLVAAQHMAAILTTFNEIDLHQVMELRSRYKERFEKAYGVSLGLMSFFARACVSALREFPNVNAAIDGDDILYHDYVNLGIAVSTERGLTVPVLRNAQLMPMAQVETEIKRLATAVREGRLSPQEMGGGTFTITNGGIFGSLLSTPILNPPQSAILGMHAIQKRPVVVDDAIVIRPMMYVALSYDHRLVDGRESVKFLVRIKELLEEPARLLIDV